MNAAEAGATFIETPCATAISEWAAGDVLHLDEGTATAEKVTIFQIEVIGSPAGRRRLQTARIHLAEPLQFAHSRGARIAMSNSGVDKNVNNGAGAGDDSMGPIIGGAVGGVIVVVVVVVVVMLVMKKKNETSKGKSQIKPWSADEDYNDTGAVTFDGPMHRDQGKAQGPQQHKKYEAKGPKKRMSAHVENGVEVRL